MTIRTFIQRALVAMALMAFPAMALAVAPVIVVQDARPRASIVVFSDDAQSCIPYAAAELAEHVEKMTGAKLPVRMISSSSPAQFNADQTVIALGTNAAKAMGIDLPPPEGVDGYNIQVKDNVIAIVGNDDAVFDVNYTWQPGSAGTLYGVYDVLRQWGVRWLDASELGTVIPQCDTLAIPVQNTTVTPRFPYRFIGYGKEMQWLRRIGAGGDRDPWATKHTFEQTIDFHAKYGASNPEYFLIGPDDQRLPYIAFGHDGVVDAIAELAREYFASDKPDGLRKYFLVIPPDGEYYCYCDPCQRQVEAARGNTGNMSNLVARAAVEVARRLEKEFPDHYIVYCAYSNYKQPPTFLDKLPGNMVVLISENRHELTSPQAIQTANDILTGWQALEPNAIYYCQYYNNTLGTIPQVLHTNIARNIGHLASAGGDGPSPVMGEMNFGPADPSLPEAWWNSFNLYVTGIYLWNPKANLSEVIADYCQHAYGPAAEPMREFWTRLDALNQDPRQRRVFGADSITELDRSLQQAIGLAPSESTYAKRLAAVDAGFAPLRTVRNRLIAESAGDPMQDLVARPIGQEVVRFSGKQKGLAIASVNVKAAYTVAAWIRPAKLLEQGCYYLLGGNERENFAFKIEDGRLYLWHQTRENGWDGIEMLWSPVLDLRPGNWYHVAASFDPKDGMTLYLDGQMLALNMNRIRPAAYPIATVAARGVTSVDQCFPGEMSDVRIYLRQLSVSEVRALAEGGPSRYQEALNQ